MKRINHERIIRFHEFIQTETHDIIVMELMRGGDLFERLSNLPDVRAILFIYFVNFAMIELIIFIYLF